MSCWVLALDVHDGPVGDLQNRLQGTAAKFRPHITLRGRFATEDAREADLREILLSVRGLLPRRIEVSDAEVVDPDMIWLECRPRDAGYAALCAAHHAIDAELAHRHMVAEDLTPSHFLGTGYRPHVTVAWCASLDEKAALSLPKVLYPLALTLYTYDKSPHADEVRCRVASLIGESGEPTSRLPG